MTDGPDEPQWKRIAANALGAVVVSAIISLVGGGIGVWSAFGDMAYNIERINDRIASLEQFRERGDRFTARDGELLREQMMRAIETLPRPPAEIRKQLADIERRLTRLEGRLSGRQ